MKKLREILFRLRALFRRERLDAEMREEMQHHLEMSAAEQKADGAPPDEARYAARRQFGGVAQIQECARDTRGWLWVAQARQDLRFAVRTFSKSPGFASVAVLTLALGIGVNTTLFSVVYGVLLAPYPYAKSGEIWAPEMIDPKTGRPWGFQLSDYHAIAELPGVATAMATTAANATLSGGINPEIITAARLTSTAFDFLGVPAVIGRGFSASDFPSGGEPEAVAVLSFKLWQRFFNGERDALGRTIVVDDKPHVVIGVMPPRFGWYTNDGAWLPLSETDQRRGVRPIVRLQPGVTREVADQQLAGLMQARAQETPTRFPRDGFRTMYHNYLDVTVASGDMRTSLQLLFCAVAFLLLIACANVANLQLARGASRSREIAVRLALGASRGRVFRQLLTESLGLSLAGGALGVLFAFWLMRLVVALMPEFYVPNEARVTMNGWVLAFSVGVALLSGILFGLAPGLQCSRPDLNAGLKSGGNVGGSTTGSARTRHTLVVVEMALSIVLLVGASLAIRGFLKLQATDRGFLTAQTLVVRLPLSPTRYPTLEQRNTFSRDLLTRLRRLPGVVSATLGAPPAFEAGSGVTIPGQPKPAGGVSLNFIDEDYRRTFGIALRGGRDLTGQDVLRGDRVALLNETAARLWTNGENPVGQIMAIDALVGGGTTNLTPRDAVKEVTIVGIVADTRSQDLRRAPPPIVFVPYTLRGSLSRSFLVRTQGNPTELVNAVRAELRALDPELPMLRPLVLGEVMDQQMMQPRFNLVLFGALAAVALGLAAAGIYSVFSYNVALRSREIGVRLALGASAGDILRLVLGSGGRLLAIGLLIGLAASIALAQLIKSQIFNIPLLDPLALAAATLLLSVAALLACYVPARRATKIDPIAALRTE